ncbi:Putative protein phosphatase 2C family protein [Klebsormidium nitens]|uniref:PPM-type phosphatase domain-containing protein n=1 Tax=Klebsormidium nitens TaxID=105231 RepID=A0A1Y1ICI9_KLENI|nr:Putative protein phosphatase 2C family protein [Klebsormidium nitens]|eukprot:GAQ85788.1 Putative protein phosphatase 2C family protein [Klebsormidium nitens]
MAEVWSPPLHSYRDASDEFSDGDGDSEEGGMAALDLEEEALRPVLRHGECKQVKKGEDLVLVEEAFKLGGRDVSCFCLFDGHNGLGAAELARERLLEMVQQHCPGGATQADFLNQLPRAMAQAFEQCDASLPQGEASGTTATVVVIDGWTVTVGGVGDSRAILDSQNGGIVPLTVDHRLETSIEEVKRVESEGCSVGRLRTRDGIQVGPLRCWPGGLCVTRSIGDRDVGPSIIAVPHVRQVEVPRCGGRIIIASDGLWDAIGNDKAAQTCRGKPAQEAARHLVKKAIESKGLRDDITCLVVDLFPPDANNSDTQGPVPRMPKSRSFLGFVKKRSLGNASSGSLVQLGSSPNLSVSPILDFPNVLQDQDLIQPDPTDGERTGGSIHGPGTFCTICGRQMVGLRENLADVSVRAGSQFRCPEHELSKR